MRALNGHSVTNNPRPRQAVALDQLSRPEAEDPLVSLHQDWTL